MVVCVVIAQKLLKKSVFLVRAVAIPSYIEGRKWNYDNKGDD